jgi:hypothetical protein
MFIFLYLAPPMCDCSFRNYPAPNLEARLDSKAQDLRRVDDVLAKRAFNAELCHRESLKSIDFPASPS